MRAIYNLFIVIVVKIIIQADWQKVMKGLDPSSTDVTKAFLEYLLEIFQKSPPLSPAQANEQIKQYLSDPVTSTQKIYRKCNELNINPEIVLRRKCGKPFMNNFLDIFPYSGDQNYPAYQQKQGQSIIICLQNIRNKVELKENIDRELYSAYYFHEATQNKSLQDPEQKDHVLIKSLYAGCYQSYRNYYLPDHQIKNMSKKCAKYLFRRRTNSDLPHDSLFRYADRLGDQI